MHIILMQPGKLVEICVYTRNNKKFIGSLARTSFLQIFNVGFHKFFLKFLPITFTFYFFSFLAWDCFITVILEAYKSAEKEILT